MNVVRLKFATKSAPTTREPNIADNEENIIELRPDQLDHITGASGDRLGNFEVQGLMSDYSAAQKPS